MYLSSYFYKSDLASQKQRMEEIRIKEFQEEGDEANLETLLDDLQSM